MSQQITAMTDRAIHRIGVLMVSVVVYALPLYGITSAQAGQSTSASPTSQTALLKSARDGLREYSNLSFKNYSLSPPVYAPGEINPDHLTGRAEWPGVGTINLLDARTREDAYASVLFELLMMPESDPPDLTPLSDGLGAGSTAAEFYVWLSRPAVRNKLQRFVRLRALPDNLKAAMSASGLASSGLQLTQGVLQVMVYAAVQKQDVEARADLVSRLLDRHGTADPALRNGFARARKTAQDTAGNALAGTCKAIGDAGEDLVGTTVDLVALAEALLKVKQVRKLIPYGWTTKVTGSVGAASALLSKATPLLMALDCSWTNVREASDNLVRVSAMGTLLRTVFTEQTVESGLSAQSDRCRAYSMACYAGHYCCNVMLQYLDGPASLNLVQAVRNVLINVLDPKKANALGEYRVRHDKYKDRFLGWSQKLADLAYASETSDPGDAVRAGNRLRPDTMARVLFDVFGDQIAQLVAGEDVSAIVRKSEATLAAVLRRHGLSRSEFDSGLTDLATDPEYLLSVAAAAMKLLLGSDPPVALGCDVHREVRRC
jgi:hypothetical protein